MHHVFSISELVDRLFDYVAIEPEVETPLYHNFSGLTREAYEGVVALGQTHRVFRENSLNALWTKQMTLIPALRAMNVITGVPKHERSLPRPLQFVSIYIMHRPASSQYIAGVQ